MTCIQRTPTPTPPHPPQVCVCFSVTVCTSLCVQTAFLKPQGAMCVINCPLSLSLSLSLSLALFFGGGGGGAFRRRVILKDFGHVCFCINSTVLCINTANQGGGGRGGSTTGAKVGCVEGRTETVTSSKLPSWMVCARLSPFFLSVFFFFFFFSLSAVMMPVPPATPPAAMPMLPPTIMVSTPG